MPESSYTTIGGTGKVYGNRAVGAANYYFRTVERREQLKVLHGKGSLRKTSLAYWRRQTTETIVESLRGAARNPLVVKPDGTIMDGNTRVTVLNERGYDAESLERPIVLDNRSEEG